MHIVISQNTIDIIFVPAYTHRINFFHSPLVSNITKKKWLQTCNVQVELVQCIIIQKDKQISFWCNAINVSCIKRLLAQIFSVNVKKCTLNCNNFTIKSRTPSVLSPLALMDTEKTSWFAKWTLYFICQHKNCQTAQFCAITNLLRFTTFQNAY